MEKNLFIDASHPEETRVVLKSKSYIEEYELENKNNLSLKNNIYFQVSYFFNLLSLEILVGL